MLSLNANVMVNHITDVNVKRLPSLADGGKEIVVVYVMENGHNPVTLIGSEENMRKLAQSILDGLQK